MTPLLQKTTPDELTQAPSGAPTPQMQCIPDWNKLARADEVSIRRADGRISSGRIDMLSMDRRVFWIIQNNGKGRIMIDKNEDSTVFRRTSDSSNERHPRS
ncbi:hypothetical protein [Arthrobacter bambusae]|uniref:hypothetical protein n=1 Tax=Arthrobacter bambusae TaxID=1338426 RepID=UPI00278310DB|nr:hypothetical protein [Arthrobacter bambusae]MDQ0212421.1 hypothetical protein [Arthrobacter bambusae]MDQ0236869.1 hypothetical protein [Arthrobacter bambusae]